MTTGKARAAWGSGMATVMARASAWMVALVAGVLVAGLPATPAMAQYESGPGAYTPQTGPAGNAHPPTQAVTPGMEETVNPFGEHNPRSAGVASSQEKHAFAASVDLSPLRSIAVFHNGRVKVLDTLARETVSAITNRRDYVEFIRANPTDRDAMRLAFDPLFTLLDLTIDPAYYTDKPLLGINYLPLRRAILEKEFPRDPEKVSAWLRLGRVTPRMVDAHAGDVAREHMDEEPYRNALGRMDEAIGLFVQSRANLVLVPPTRRDQPWSHVATLPADHEVRKAMLALGEAWRARDAAGVHSAALSLAAALPAVSPEVYPTSRRDLEILYNRVNAFEWGAWAYLVSLVALILAFGTGRRWVAGTGVALLILAMGLHAFGFTARCIIAERFAIQNQFESMTGVSLFAAIVGLAIMLARRQWLFGAAAAAVGFMVLLTATQARIPGVNIEREAAILNTSVLLKYHVSIVLVSYGLISLGFIISLFYLGVHYASRLRQGLSGGLSGGSSGGSSGAVARDQSVASPAPAATLDVERLANHALAIEPAPVAGTARTLKDLDTSHMIVLQLAFWTLGVGILLGAWWADHSWGRWWAFDPKETWALITWIVYLIVIHLRFTQAKNKALTTAWLSVVGFFIMLWCYFGVNLLLPGLHAYA